MEILELVLGERGANGVGARGGGDRHGYRKLGFSALLAEGGR